MELYRFFLAIKSAGMRNHAARGMPDALVADPPHPPLDPDWIAGIVRRLDDDLASLAVSARPFDRGYSARVFGLATGFSSYELEALVSAVASAPAGVLKDAGCKERIKNVLYAAGNAYALAILHESKEEDASSDVEDA